MKIQIASDLHHELAQGYPELGRPLSLTEEADVLVLAGGIHKGIEAVNLYADYRVPVVYVAGNSEALESDYEALVAKLREQTQGTSVQFLQDDEFVLGKVRFLGATLWTDYSAHPLRLNDAMRATGTEKVEHGRSEKRTSKFFQPENPHEHQRRSLRWLSDRLDHKFAGGTVVVTHHTPSGMSIPQRDRPHALVASSATNVELLVVKADLWIHGHIEASSDYHVGDCRVICNPRGRPRKNQGKLGVPYENASFYPSFVIDL